MAIRDLPDMYALGPRAYISGKSPMPMLQPLHIPGKLYTILVHNPRMLLTFKLLILNTMQCHSYALGYIY